MFLKPVPKKWQNGELAHYIVKDGADVRLYIPKERKYAELTGLQKAVEHRISVESENDETGINQQLDLHPIVIQRWGKS